MSTRKRSRIAASAIGWLFLIACLACPPAHAVVFNEIHYHPPLGQENLEFIELANDSSTPEDLSGYQIVEGVRFTFPPGTILPGKGFLVVCASAQALKAKYGITNAIGDFVGLLDNGGETISLVNQSGIPLLSVTFGDNGKWPVAPDGTGLTLSLRDVHLDSREPESWRPSDQLNGTPGVSNFTASGPVFIEETIVDKGTLWRYKKGTEAFSAPEDAWRAPAFNDGGWLEGPSGFGYEDGDDATILDDMLNNYIAVAIRKKFQISQAQLDAAGDFYLAVNYDDGFCAFLNGSEAARGNCGEPGAVIAWNAPATAAREQGAEDLYVIPKGLFRAGENVLALDGHNFSIGSSDMSLTPRLVHRTIVTVHPTGKLPIIFNELFRGANGNGWVELYNAGGSAIDLAGYRLTDDPDRADPYVFPAPSSIPGGSFLTIPGSAGPFNLLAPKVRFFLIDAAGAPVSSTSFDRDKPAGVQEGFYSQARFPDGSDEFWTTLTPTPAAANRIQRVTGIVFNEIYYHPPEERPGEFLELYNRSSQAIDISNFRFTRGITYTIPAGTVLPRDGYLVIAEDPDLVEQQHGIANVLGPYEGQLANDGENLRLVDLLDNTVDEVRYQTGGAWSLWADGRGSSLEVIDPNQDNSVASAWAASDETGKASWEELKYSVAAYAPGAETELHLFLSERGACLIDDISITRAGGPNMIPNPGFEANTTPWRIEGTHIRSQRITTDHHGGAACLRVEATGKGDTTVNRIETDTAPRLTAGALEVSLWARWQRGTSLIIANGEFTAGSFGGRPSPSENISGNTLGGRFRMSVPFNLGTPGKENSVRAALRAETGGVNLGPVISEVINDPPSPAAGAQVKISARVSDSDGVASVRVLYALGNAQGQYTPIDLHDDGQSNDGAAGDGVYAGSITGLTGQARVVFYIEAFDVFGMPRRFPTEAPARTNMFVADGSVNDPIDSVRYYLDTAKTSELGTRRLHSNDLLEGTLVFNNEEIYYNVGMRYRGSPWGRPSLQRFRVHFQKDNLFHRGLNDINLGNSGGAPNEGSGYFLAGRAGTESVPAPAADFFYVRGRFNGNSYGTQSMIQTVDRAYMEKWFGDGALGPALKAVGRLQFNDGGQRTQWDGASFVHMNNITENYRAYFIHTMRQTQDDWDPFIQLTSIMDRRKTTNVAEFDAKIDTVLDVQAFLRQLAPQILMAGWDAFCVGNGHNGYLGHDSRDGRWEYLPFDMDLHFGDPNINIFTSSDGDVARLLTRPFSRRIYLRTLSEYVDGYWNAAVAGPFLDQVTRDTGVNASSIKSYLTTSNTSVRNQIRTATTAVFQITSNGGNDIQIEAITVDLEGDAPVQVESIQYQRNSGEIEPLTPAWTTPTHWKATLAIPSAVNLFTFTGYDARGNLLASDSITVSTTIVAEPPTITAWFPATGPVAGGTTVTFFGTNFTPGAKVLFGGADSPSVTVQSKEVLLAVAPQARLPLPSDGKIDIELQFTAQDPVILPLAFIYTGIPTSFVRGDANGDQAINLADPVATLLFLFTGRSLKCLDGADVDDSGKVEINDAILGLQFLYLKGSPPAKPFPAAGQDTTADNLGCSI